MVVFDIMRRHFITAAPGDGLPEVHQTMRLARLRHLMVAQEERLMGIVSYRDLVEWMMTDSAARSPQPTATVAEAMVRSPFVATPSTTLAEAAGRLCHYRVGCLPVVEEGEATYETPRMLGLITETDLLRAAFAKPGRRFED
jgi:acetoin utilization protein AcuB